MFRYTFIVKDFKTRRFSNISKIFNEKLSIEGVRRELGVLFDSDNYKNVMLKSVEQLDIGGNVVKKFDINKW